MARAGGWWKDLLTDARGSRDLCGPDGLRQNNFDLIRLIMAVMVIFTHSYPIAKGEVFSSGIPTEPLQRFTYGVQTFGGLAVNSFFVLSGFLITMSWERSANPLQYLLRRIGRIYPGFLVAMLFCAVVIAPIFTVAPYPGLNGRLLWDYVWRSAVLQEHWVPGVFLNNRLSNALNSSVWTIRFELGCYLFVMLLGLATFIRRRWVVLTVFLSLNVLMVAQRWNGLAVTANLSAMLQDFGMSESTFQFLDRYFGELRHWPGLLTHFMAGAVFYVWRDKIPQRLWLFVLAMGAYWGILASCHSLGLWGYYTRFLVPVLMPIALAYSLFWAAFQRYLGLPRIAKYGDFSYGTYLYAFPIQQAIAVIMGASLTSAFVLFAIATPVTLVFAVMSWYCVERHFIRRRKGEKKAAIPAGVEMPLGMVPAVVPVVANEAPLDPAQQAARSF
jgi:peptidoglycan/LPS O-acetylase OafA/YrhL